MAVKIYTRNGDHGETRLCDGSAITKDATRVEAYGSVDELNSFVGLCIVKLDQEDVKMHLIRIQRELLAIGANLAFPSNLSQEIIKGKTIANKIPRITDEFITNLEKHIDDYETELPKLTHFILCGGNEPSTLLHVARTVCRRAERQIVKLRQNEEVDKNVLKYMNRLSDYFFTAARLASIRTNNKDIEWP